MYCNGERGVKEFFFFWKRETNRFMCVLDFRILVFFRTLWPTNCVCLTQYGYYYYYQERTIYGYIFGQIGSYGLVLTNSALREWESFLISILELDNGN